MTTFNPAAERDARRWLLAYVLEFDDDGEPEGAILHRGTEEECERLASMLPAVAYNGPRNVLRASMRWAPEAPNPEFTGAHLWASACNVVLGGIR